MGRLGGFDIEVSRNKFEMEKYSVPATVAKLYGGRAVLPTNHMCSSQECLQKR